jgi:hypothetical protein
MAHFGHGASSDLSPLFRGTAECQSAFKFGSDSLLMQFEGCLAL